MSHRFLAISLPLVLFACRSDDASGPKEGGGSEGGGSEDSGGPSATMLVFDPERPDHFFDRPFPDDTLRTEEGRPDLSGFPEVTGVPLGAVASGWTWQAGQATWDFANNGAAWLRFDGPLRVPDQTAGESSDPVLLIDLDTGRLHALDLRFVEDPADDPFLASNLLCLGPQAGATPRSGARLAAVVMEGAGARENPDHPVDAEVRAALTRAGVSGEPAAATVYTVQDSARRLAALGDAAQVWMRENVDWSSIPIERVVRLTYTQGTTPSGEPSTLAITTFESGREAVAYMVAGDTTYNENVVEFDESWPMIVYEAQVPLPLYSGLEDRPYMSAGAGLLLDGQRGTGWIEVLPDGTVVETPDTEVVRVVIQIPREEGGISEDARVLIWDHGTGGHAYNILQRRDNRDQNIELISRFAAENVAIISHDQPLYGTRFPLIDEGFTDGSLGFYNIGNLPAFRDNQTQGAIEGAALLVFAEEGLNDLLPEGGVSSDRPRRAGHSLGSVTAHLGAQAAPGRFDRVLASGSGGVLSLMFLETGLGGSTSGIVDSLSALLGVEVTEDTDVGVVLAAALGIDDPEARTRFDRLHPVVNLFQWILDGADPTAGANTENVPVRFIRSEGDFQVPNSATDALIAVLPDAVVSPCVALGDYDPHHCTFREQEGFDAVQLWLEEGR